MQAQMLRGAVPVGTGSTTAAYACAGHGAPTVAFALAVELFALERAAGRRVAVSAPALAASTREKAAAEAERACDRPVAAREAARVEAMRPGVTGKATAAAAEEDATSAEFSVLVPLKTTARPLAAGLALRPSVLLLLARFWAVN